MREGGVICEGFPPWAITTAGWRRCSSRRSFQAAEAERRLQRPDQSMSAARRYRVGTKDRMVRWLPRSPSRVRLNASA